MLISGLNNDNIVLEQLVYDSKELVVKEYYYSDGTMRKRGGFRENNRQGIWSFWSKKGKLIKRQVWNNGELLSTSIN